MKKFIGGNWKLNPTSIAEAENIVKNIKFPKDPDNLEVVIFPPLLFLEDLSKNFSSIKWGAQDFFFEDSGPYTGEVSLPMLKDASVNYVLVGHSDRRIKFGETDEIVNQKVLSALEEGFSVVLAVGEKEKNDESIKTVIQSLEESVKGVSKEYFSKIKVAYEPVWSISTSGTGEVATPEYASEAISNLKECFNVGYLYGGSIDSKNVQGFLSFPNIEGFLIGGASLKPDEFSKILEAASRF